MLTALALGARELAGYRDEDRPEVPKFPSKELPKHLQQLYGEQRQSQLELASQRLEQGMVQPLALTAADQLSGPNALKVRTFSSRMEVEKKKTKPTPNALASNVAEWFFLPLINGWWMARQSLYVLVRPITFIDTNRTPVEIKLSHFPSTFCRCMCVPWLFCYTHLGRQL
jgi:telomere length regulation protein